jgi:hypothetical protein
MSKGASLGSALKRITGAKPTSYELEIILAARSEMAPFQFETAGDEI